MDNILEFLKGFNLQMIISLVGIMWYFNHHIESKLEKMETELKDLNKIQSARSDQLYQMFIELLRDKK